MSASIRQPPSARPLPGSAAAIPAARTPATAEIERADAFEPKRGTAVVPSPTPAAVSPALLGARSTPLDAAAAAALAPSVGAWNTQGAALVTTATVEEALADADAFPPALAAQVKAALGRDGPLGAVGPLGFYGPIGERPWSPSYWMGKLGDWTATSARLTAKGGPGSAKGSLGDDGPLAAHDRFPAVFQAGGALGAHGPTGALGPAGALGYAGKLGGHGLATDADGRYVREDGSVQRRLQVERADGSHGYELFELYASEDAVKAATDNDTSWLVRGRVDDGTPVDTYPFTSHVDQVVTLTACPEHIDESYRVELLDAAGQRIATADSRENVNWIQFEAKAGQQLQVRVSRIDDAPKGSTMMTRALEAYLTPLVLGFSWLSDGPVTPQRGRYGLCVVGSTAEVPKATDAGPHQRRVTWQPRV